MLINHILFYDNIRKKTAKAFVLERSPLALADVEDLREGKVVECSFCSVSIGR